MLYVFALILWAAPPACGINISLLPPLSTLVSKNTFAWLFWVSLLPRNSTTFLHDQCCHTRCIIYWMSYLQDGFWITVSKFTWCTMIQRNIFDRNVTVSQKLANISRFHRLLQIRLCLHNLESGQKPAGTGRNRPTSEYWPVPRLRRDRHCQLRTLGLHSRSAVGGVKHALQRPVALDLSLKWSSSDPSSFVLLFSSHERARESFRSLSWSQDSSDVQFVHPVVLSLKLLRLRTWFPSWLDRLWCNRSDLNLVYGQNFRIGQQSQLNRPNNRNEKDSILRGFPHPQRRGKKADRIARTDNCFVCSSRERVMFRLVCDTVVASGMRIENGWWISLIRIFRTLHLLGP